MKVPNRLSAAVVALMVSFAPGPSSADVAGDAVQFLEAQGYEVVRLERTFLGRIRIEAERGELRREMVLDRNSGEVLRDLIREGDDGDDGAPDRGGSFWDRLFGDAVGGNGDGFDRDDRGDDDDQDDRDDRDDNDDRDDRDDRDDSDNSGRGSNNSGRDGGGNSGRGGDDD